MSVRGEAAATLMFEALERLKPHLLAGTRVWIQRCHNGHDQRMVISAARAALLDRFQWQSGHADVWRVFADPEAFATVVAGLVEPWRDRGVTKVLGVESRGFLLGGAASLALGAGFVAVRKSDGLLPGPKLTVEADEDYRGRRHRLRMQAVVGPGDRVLMVDDWAERGSQARAAQELVESAAGADFLGLSVLVDQMTAAARLRLNAVTSLATADELGSAG